MSGYDEIVPVNGNVGNGCYREIQLQGLPMIPVIEGDVNAEFGTRVEQALLCRILSDGMYERRGRDAASDELPGFPVVAGAIDKRSAVVEAVAFDGGIGLSGGEVRCFDE